MNTPIKNSHKDTSAELTKGKDSDTARGIFAKSVNYIFLAFKQNWKMITSLIAIVLLYILYLRETDIEKSINTPLFIVINSFFSAVIISLLVVLGHRVIEKISIQDWFRETNDTLRRDIYTDVQNIFSTNFHFGLKEIKEGMNDENLISGTDISSISWLNTKLEPPRIVLESLEKAVLRGANVRLLLMHQDNPSLVLRARDSCDNYKDKTSVEADIEAYRKDHSACITRAENIVRELELKKKENDAIGKLEIRYYMDMPAVPILILEKGEHHEEAYSGFYLNKFSSALPVIKWTSRGKGFIDNLYDYFEKKWYFAEIDASTGSKSRKTSRT